MPADRPCVVHVTLADPDRAEAALAALAAAGLVVVRHRRRLGVVTGTVDPGRIASLRQLPGVRAVERDREVSGTEPRPESDL
jgi:MYXO-CTERM domain-containing protein